MSKLLNFLEQDKNTRKIFGKRELKIIEKQLMGVGLTQSEKNRLSRDIREKLKFIRGISRFEDDFELKKSEVIKDLIQGAVEVIKEDSKFHMVKRILLFGSTVENKRTLRSDIDIAVEFSKCVDLKEATKFRIRISGKLPERVDIQVLNVLPVKIKKSIQNKHNVLFQR